MTKERIQKEAETFFEWPGENKEVVTLTSCLLFAKHISEITWKQATVSAINDEEWKRG